MTAETHPYAGLEQTDTDYRTKIGYKDPELPVDDYWPADYLYLHKRTYYEYLDEYNQEIRNGKWTNGPHFTRQDNSHLIGTMALNLGLTPPERAWAKRIFMALDLGRWGTRKDSVALAVCAYVVEQSERTDRRAHPNVPRQGRDRRFNEILDSLTISERQFRKDYNKIQHHERTRR